MIGYLAGPALLAFGVAWLAVLPDDWTGPVVVIPTAAVVTTWAQVRLTVWRRRRSGFRPSTILAARLAGIAGGVALVLLLYFDLLRY